MFLGILEDMGRGKGVLGGWGRDKGILDMGEVTFESFVEAGDVFFYFGGEIGVCCGRCTTRDNFDLL
jgi:hypothetical protein